jgi:hypothetical protein
METVTMLGKTYTAIILALTLVAGAATMTAASTAVTQIDLSRDGSFTVLTIHGSGPLRYAHQSVEATEGKPFRVVVDCLAARHNLPWYNFTNLPPSVVTAIRTSQYSVTPEEVVRVVLDLANESVYRVEAAGDNIKVYVSDPKTAPFATWTSGTAKTPPSPEHEPVAAKTSPEKPKPTVATAKPTTATETPTKKPTVVAKTTPTDNENANKATPSQVAKMTPPDNKSAETPRAEEPAVKKTVPAQELAYDSIERAKAFAKIQTAPKKTPVPSVAEKPKNDEAQPEPSHKTAKETSPTPVNQEPSSVKPTTTTKSEPVAPSSAAQDKDTELADADDSAKKEKVDLSRYRRASAKEAEIKASKVVEFPKRMVIKYTKTNPRDPFEALVALDDNQKQHAVDLNKAPNAEALSLVGILQSVVGKNAALLQNRDGIGYIMRTGDRVQNGYVAQIRENAVYFQINEYGWSRTLVKHMEKSN